MCEGTGYDVVGSLKNGSHLFEKAGEIRCHFATRSLSTPLNSKRITGRLEDFSKWTVEPAWVRDQVRKEKPVIQDTKMVQARDGRNFLSDTLGNKESV